MSNRQLVKCTYTRQIESRSYKIETIQRKLRRLVAKHPDCPVLPFSRVCDTVLNDLNLQSLKGIRIMFDVIFACNVFKNLISDLDIIQLLSINVLYRSPRNFNLLHSEQYRAAYMCFNYVNRIAVHIPGLIHLTSPLIRSNILRYTCYRYMRLNFTFIFPVIFLFLQYVCLFLHCKIPKGLLPANR